MKPINAVTPSGEKVTIISFQHSESELKPFIRPYAIIVRASGQLEACSIENLSLSKAQMKKITEEEV